MCLIHRYDVQNGRESLGMCTEGLVPCGSAWVSCWRAPMAALVLDDAELVALGVRHHRPMEAIDLMVSETAPPE